MNKAVLKWIGDQTAIELLGIGFIGMVGVGWLSLFLLDALFKP
jgi:hypothetical protein